MNYSKKGISKKTKKIDSKATKLYTKLGITLVKVILLSIIALGVIGVTGVLGVMNGLIENAPDVNSISLTPVGYATKTYDAAGNEIASLVKEGSNRTFATIEEIPKHLQYAFIDIEDQRFYENNGIDFKGILRAGFRFLQNPNGSVEGASTITQQLIKGKIFDTGMGETTALDRVKRKLQEQYLAVELTKKYSKEEILENYLNMINLGNNTLGVQAASRRYFNKDVWDLTLSESAVIAGITKNPTAYDPILYPEENNKRRKLVLDKMLEFSHITQAEYDEAMVDDVYARIQNVNVQYENESSVYSYFTDAVINQVYSDLQQKLGYDESQAYQLLWSGGLSIFTTQDSAIQAICDEEYLNEDNFPSDVKYSIDWAWSVQHSDGTVDNYSHYSMERYFQEGDAEKGLSPQPFFRAVFGSVEEANENIQKFKEAHQTEADIVLGEKLYYAAQPQSSFVVMDQSTGYVKALVGGRGEKQTSRSLNRAVDTKRQPGSTFKVVSTYAAALDTAGFTLGSVQYDEAGYHAPDGTPFANVSKNYTGYTTLRYAIAKSVNVVAVKTMVDISPSLGFSYLKNFGFTTLVENEVHDDGKTYTDIGYALALGGITDGVTNYELTASYAAIANGGVYMEPVLYTKVLDHNGNVILENQPNKRKVIKETTAWLLTDAMKDVVRYGTSTACALDNMTVAGKSGSTTSYNDVWFVGYTPYYTAGIWSGYDNNRSQSGELASYHKKLWAKIMNRIHENLENKDFAKPSGITTATICKKSGKLAVAGVCDRDPRGSQLIREYFAEGTVPTEYCDNHIKVSVCAESGLLSSENCPPELIQERVYMSMTNLTTTNTSQVTNPDGTVSTVTTAGASEDSQYFLPSSLKDQYCPIHTPGATPSLPEGETLESQITDTLPSDGSVPTSPMSPTQSIPVPTQTDPNQPQSTTVLETTTVQESPTYPTEPQTDPAQAPTIQGPDEGIGPWQVHP